MKSQSFTEMQSCLLINHHLDHYLMQAFVGGLRQHFLSNDHTETAPAKHRVNHDTQFLDVSRPAVELIIQFAVCDNASFVSRLKMPALFAFNGLNPARYRLRFRHILAEI